MFTKISPQKVVHTSGYIVQVADRFHVEYIEGEKRAKIEVDFGEVIGIYRTTLTRWGDGTSMSEIEKDEVVNRVSDALSFMGSETEIC